MVTMNDNLTDRVEATVSGHELRLWIKRGMSVRDATLRAEVTVGQLDRLASNGGRAFRFSDQRTSPNGDTDYFGGRIRSEGEGQ